LSAAAERRLLMKLGLTPGRRNAEMSRLAIGFLTALPVAALLLAPKLAYAGIEACGNIDVRANATCKVEVQGGCTAKCTPVSVQAACEGKLELECDAKCNVTAEASCTGSCNADCTGQCKANPGSFDCKASCTGSCTANCDAACEGQAGGGSASGSCKANCQANCNAKCEGECNVTPPSATCEAKCSASCKGSCEGKLNASCQAQCRGEFDPPKCQAEVKGGCEARCQTPEGALFCDGEFIDTGNNLKACGDALAALFNIQVDYSASAECANGVCNAEASASASACSTSPDLSHHAASFAPAALALGIAGASVARRKRR